MHPGGDPEVPRGRRSQKKRKKISGKTGFPGSEPDFRICVHGIVMGGPRTTCSQNFIPLAAIVPEIAGSLTIIKYRIHMVRGGGLSQIGVTLNVWPLMHVTLVPAF